jgi:uncharacterized protein GlcG (DUF336 family)
MKIAPLVIAAGIFTAPPAPASDVLVARSMSMEIARDIATGAVEACRELGYQVSAVVVDRSGAVQAVLRDPLATRFNTEIATKKANAAVLGNVSTTEFLANREDITAVMNHLDDVLVLKGAVPVRAAGALLGAVGVSGALGGELDEKCALQGLEHVSERLEFAD